ncbi:MAG: beta-class carbonic anhydrase [Myxococcaceae bacterium]
MAFLDDVLGHNARWVEARNRPLSKVPQKKVVIFTCMDTRLVDFLEQAMGLGRGDAQVIKNAGNTWVDPGGGVIRSLVVAIYALGCEEVFVIGHTDCGMAQIDEAALKKRMSERGVQPEAISSLQPDLHSWLGAFSNPKDNVQRVVELIRTNPLLPRDLPVAGLMFDPVSGQLRPVGERKA